MGWKVAMTLHRTTLAIAIAVSLVVFGALSGIVIDQIRFNRHRMAVLKPPEDALTHRNQMLMKLELATNGRHPAFEAEWRQSLEDIDDAWQTANPGRAVAAWHDAYRVAVRTGRWDAMIDVGDAALRVGAVSEFREAPDAAARRSYLTALFRARGQASLDGVLRACQGFALLGDVSVVQQCIGIGHELAKTDPVADGHVAAFARQFTSHPAVAVDEATITPGL